MNSAEAQRERIARSRKVITDVQRALLHAPANDVYAALGLQLTHALDCIVDAIEELEKTRGDRS